MYKNSYPESVQEFCNKSIKVLVKTNFLENEFVDVTERDYQILYDELCKYAFETSFLPGKEYAWEDDETKHMLESSLLSITVDRLMRKGLIDNIEDENGEKQYFLTKKGKKLQYENNK